MSWAMIDGTEKIIKFDNIEISEEEKEMSHALKPLFYDCWNEIKQKDMSHGLFVSYCVQRPMTYFQFDGKTKYSVIGMPGEDTHYAMVGADYTFQLHSGNTVKVSAMTKLEYMLAHEITHCHYPIEDQALNEIYADDLGMQRVMRYEDGETLAAAYYSLLACQANAFGYSDFRDARALRFGVEFSDKSLDLVQCELDFYQKNPQIIKDIANTELKEEDKKDFIYALGFSKVNNDGR